VATATAPPGGGAVLATPKVRKLAQERGVDVGAIVGTGPGGRVTEEDVGRAGQQVTTPAAVAVPPPPKPSSVKLNYDFYGHIDHRPFRGMRKVIAERMTESAFTIPHATAMEEVDATALWDLRERLKGEAAKQGVPRLSFLPLIAMAVVKALLEHPTLNAELDAENEDIVVKRYVNLGIAVDTPEGLMVPNVKRAEQKDMWQVARDIDELTQRARSRKIDLAELRGGSFTITNYGSIGGMFGVPLINFPEAAILGVGRIREVPRVVEGKVVVRKVVGLSVSFDHRVVDGAEVAAFINTLKGLLESPESPILTGP
jgi:pyruvate dehydrogenase E2 component (dihydrolipoamide acetyltransferase)